MAAHADTHGHDAHGPDAHAVHHAVHPNPFHLHPVALGLIVFLASEVALFGAFFMWYAHARLLDGLVWVPEGFEIPADATSINTAVLVASSFTCELVLWNVLKDNRKSARNWLLLTILLGAAFMGLQIHEYLTIGFTPQDTAVGSIFFTLTGLHGAHVFLGLTLLTLCLVRLRRGQFSPDNHTGLFVTSIYWHFVDVVWIVLYTVVYLLPDSVG